MPLLPILTVLLSLAAAAEPVPAPPGPDGAPMVLVPAGEFTRGNRGGEANERPARTLFLDSFALDQVEVTVARFAAFASATGHRTVAEREGWAWVWAGEWGKGGKFVRTRGAEWRHPKGAGSAPLPEDPVTQVAYPDAEAYCRWAGKRLPSEAEWEKAARGSDGRPYPWGETFEAARANTVGAADGFPEVAPVGSFPAGVSPYGVLDMAGNVWEWTADWYRADYYAAAPARNPPGPPAGKARVVRGGSWGGPPDWSTVTNRYDRPPDYRNTKIGFRCARDAR